MIRWPSRVRRAASLLLGVHLLQIVLLAASAVCDLNGTPAQSMVSAQATSGAHATGPHASHASQVSDATHDGQHVTAAENHDGSTPPVHHHAPSEAGSCPMAMACTVTAVVARVPAIETHVITIATNDVAHVSAAPASTRRAPEPPPPRA